MSNLTKLNQLLKSQPIKADSIEAAQLLDYAKNISRMEILAKLQVKNSMEACRIAKTMKII